MRLVFIIIYMIELFTHGKEEKKLKNFLNLQNSIPAKIDNFFIENLWHKFKRNIFRNHIRN